MKRLITLHLLWIGAFACTTLTAQVKIGDNPNTINTNSLLELESTTKGFLAPRVTLTATNSAAPLTAPVPSGMMVYNTGGAVTEGYYVWNGSAWLRILTSVNGRNNYVLVKSSADFPAPVSGVITLVSGTLYEINGTVSLSSRINLNGAWIRGADAVNDKLVYTGSSGELFTGSTGGNLRLLTLSAPNAGARLFGLDAAGANVNFIVENCYIIGCQNIGMIRGYAGTVYMQTIACFSNLNGITFENDTNVVLTNMLWDKSNSNIYEKFNGTISVIEKMGGAMQVLSANTATAIDVSGLTSLRAGELKSVLFYGNGTYKAGTFSKNWEAESTGLVTEKDDVSSGNLYISATGTTSFSNINTPVKVVGTTTASNLFRMTSPTSNRLTYTGTKTKRFQVICSLAAQFTNIFGNKYFSFYIAKNGVVLPESKQRVRLISNADQTGITLSCTVSLVPNDYIEVFVENNSDATDIVIQQMNLAAK